MEGTAKGKRELILEAAEKIFSEKGFFQAKVEEIAIEAGVGKGTVYEYFVSKEEVFQEMLLKVLQDSELKGKFPKKNTSTAEKIEFFLNGYHEFLTKHKNIARMMIHEHVSMSKEMLRAIQARKEENFWVLENIVVSGIATGQLRSDIEPKLTAHLIMGATLSLSGDILEGDNTMSAEEHTAWVIDMIFRGIGSDCNTM